MLGVLKTSYGGLKVSRGQLITLTKVLRSNFQLNLSPCDSVRVRFGVSKCNISLKYFFKESLHDEEANPFHDQNLTGCGNLMLGLINKTNETFREILVVQG